MKTNKQNSEDIVRLYDHEKIANHEMGVIKGDISLIQKDVQSIKEHVTWVKSAYEDMKEQFEKVDSRTWYILTAIIIGFLATIAVFAIGLYFK